MDSASAKRIDQFDRSVRRRRRIRAPPTIDRAACGHYRPGRKGRGQRRSLMVSSERRRLNLGTRKSHDRVIDWFESEHLLLLARFAGK